MIRRDVTRRLKTTLLNEQEAGSSSYRTLLFMTLFGFSTLTNAANFNWDGRTYIPLGLQPRSETVLRMPEGISAYWPEEAEALNFNKIDDRTLSVSPKQATVEQRVFLRGESGKLYLIKASTELKHVPIIEVTDVTAKTNEPFASPGGGDLTPATMMFKMMRNELPVGFARAHSTRSILVTADYRIDALEVWSSPQMTGIVTAIVRTGAPGSHVEINPAAIEIYIPEFGPLRIIGADKWSLDDGSPSTQGYLVFTKS